mmetsp:Transcript_30616/g.66815  ORF Transcript_30616/g.66815 Transcript_30616/m.66815 type:complete len:201 (+) Transcript_30616:218-820(+)
MHDLPAGAPLAELLRVPPHHPLVRRAGEPGQRLEGEDDGGVRLEQAGGEHGLEHLHERGHLLQAHVAHEEVQLDAALSQPRDGLLHLHAEVLRRLRHHLHLRRVHRVHLAAADVREVLGPPPGGGAGVHGHRARRNAHVPPGHRLLQLEEGAAHCRARAGGPLRVLTAAAQGEGRRQLEAAAEGVVRQLDNGRDVAEATS